MIFKHKKLSESVVMREFEKVAMAKGMVKVTEEPVIAKKASASFMPSNNLVDDMLKLADGLRERGFEKDAKSLEEKVLSYKLAETHLYRAIDEDAEDMLEFAHPKKNKIEFEAQNGDGEVEDTLSQHKKIIDIVNKQPKKIAFDVLAETADILGLKKKANQDELDKKITRINVYRNEVNELLNTSKAYYYVNRSSKWGDFAYLGDIGSENALFIGNAKVKAGYPLIEGNKSYNNDQFSKDFLNYFRESNNLEDGVIWSHFLKGDLSFEKIITDEAVSHANNNLDEEYNLFLNKINSLPAIKKQDDGLINIDDVNKFIEAVNVVLHDKYFKFVFSGLTTNNFNGLEDKSKEYISGMIDTAHEILKLVEPKIQTSKNTNDGWNAGWANVIAGRFESVSDKDSDPTYFKNLAALIRSNGDKPYNDLYTKLVAFDSDLDKAKDFHQLDLIGQQWQKNYKVAFKFNGLVKEARDPFVTPSATPATVPAAYKQPVGRNAGRSAVKEPSNFEKNNTDEFKAVSTMQNSLQLLADHLDKFNVNAKDVPKIRQILLGTGGAQGSFVGRVDGIWGVNTENALKEAAKITNSKLVTDAQRINGQLQGNSSEKVIEFANKNVDALNEALSKVDVKVNSINKSHHNGFLDNLPADSNLLQSEPSVDEDENGIDLSPNDLSSFGNLSNFIRRNFKNLDFSAGGLNYQTWETILNWFYKRANKQAKQLAGVAGQEDLKKLKANYAVLAQNLYDNLYKFQESSENKDPTKILSSKQLDGNTSLTSVQKSTGPTVPATYKTNTNADGTEVENGEINKIEPPPFGYEFNIVSLYNKYGHSMEYFDQYKNWLSIPIFNVNDFSYHPTQISAKYVKALTPQDILALNGISNPNTLIPGQTTTKYTYLDLMNSNIPAAVSMRNRANDYALLSIINGLSRDLPAIMSAYVQTSPSDKYNRIIASAWDKWAANLSQTRSRINSDFSSNGQIPKVIF